MCPVVVVASPTAGIGAVPSVVDVLRAAWRANRGSIGTILALTLLFGTPIDIVLCFFPPGTGTWGWLTAPRFRIEQGMAFWLGTAGSLALVQLALLNNRGEPATLSATMERAFARYGQGLWTQFLLNLGTVVGLILLLVPGIWLSVSCVFWQPIVLVEEVSGTAALRRSIERVRGRWWGTFRLLLALFLGVLLVSFLLGLPLAFLPDGPVSEIVGGFPARLVDSALVLCLTQFFLLTGGGAAGEADASGGAAASAAPGARPAGEPQPSGDPFL